MDTLHIGLVYGGRSGEHEVSLRSAASVYKHLDPSKYVVVPIGITKKGEWYCQEKSGWDGLEVLPLVENTDMAVSMVPGKGFFRGGNKLKLDVVFPVLHGTFGEDGTFQGLMEMMDIPYIGANVIGSAVGMDKERTKQIWEHAGLPVVPFTSLLYGDYKDEGFNFTAFVDEIIDHYGFPLFIKPCEAGSSVGIKRVTEKSALKDAIEYAFRFDTKILIEPGIDAREIECSVLGNEKPETFVPGEIAATHEFYDYEAKYTDPDGAKLLIPAPLEKEQYDLVRELAVKAYKALGIEGLSRVDFFLDRKSGKIMLNEINTMPGFTSVSMYSMMCEAGGLKYNALIDRLVAFALKRSETRKRLQFSL